MTMPISNALHQDINRKILNTLVTFDKRPDEARNNIHKHTNSEQNNYIKVNHYLCHLLPRNA